MKLTTWQGRGQTGRSAGCQQPLQETGEDPPWGPRGGIIQASGLQNHRESILVALGQQAHGHLSQWPLETNPGMVLPALSPAYRPDPWGVPH